MKNQRIRISHLEEVEMGYFEHMKFALGVTGGLLSAAALCGIHAFIPFIFTDSASKRIKSLSRIIDTR